MICDCSQTDVGLSPLFRIINRKVGFEPDVGTVRMGVIFSSGGSGLTACTTAETVSMTSSAVSILFISYSKRCGSAALSTVACISLVRSCIVSFNELLNPNNKGHYGNPEHESRQHCDMQYGSFDFLPVVNPHFYIFRRHAVRSPLQIVC